MHYIPLLTPAVNVAYVHTLTTAHQTLSYPIPGSRLTQDAPSRHPSINARANVVAVFRGSPPTPLRVHSCENVFAALIPSGGPLSRNFPDFECHLQHGGGHHVSPLM